MYLRCGQFYCQSFERQALVTPTAIPICLRRLGTLDRCWDGDLQLLVCDISLGTGHEILLSHSSPGFRPAIATVFCFLDSLAKCV